MKKLIIFFLLGFFLFNIKLLAEDEPYVRIEPIKQLEVKIVKENDRITNKHVIREPSVEERKEIERIFGDKADIAVAVFKHESGLNYKAQNWNCYYYNEEGKRYSTSCKVQDRHLAWSSDCGIIQKNVKGQTCPAELLTFEGSMKAGEKVYKDQGLKAWASYNNQKYKKFLN